MINWLSVAAINLAIAVTLGAFGAHGLTNIASPEQLAWWHTGTQYFFYHALGLLLVALLIKMGLPAKGSAWLLQLGIFIFVGSLFAMALGAPRWFGAITPIGGVMFIGAWLWLAFVAIRHPIYSQRTLK